MFESDDFVNQNLKLDQNCYLSIDLTALKKTYVHKCKLTSSKESIHDVISLHCQHLLLKSKMPTT